MRPALWLVALASGSLACDRPALSVHSLDGAPPPLAVIASPDTSDVHFDVIGPVHIAGDSTVVVALPRTRQVATFRPDGTLRAVAGRPGQGPGELQALDATGLLGDTVWTWDPLAGRVSLFSLDGVLLATEHPEFPIPEWEHPGTLVALLQGGTALVEGRHSVSGIASGAVPGHVPQALFGRGGKFMYLFEARDLRGWAFSTAGEAAGTVGIQPFAQVPLLVASPGGERFAMIGTQPAGDGELSVRVLDAGGNLLYWAVLPLRGDLLTRARRDSAFRNLGPPFPDLPAGTLRIPEQLPSVDAALFGTDGRLWLRLDPGVLGRPVTRWAVIAADGAAVDTVALPTVHRLARPERGAYWAVVLDSLEVPSLHRYAMPTAP